MFLKLDLFPSSAEEWETANLLRPLAIRKRSHWRTHVIKKTAV
jgi:hypothetical protein